MAIPAAQMAAVGRYLLKQRLAGRERYPLVLMLEPLFRCNLSCTGCGKIQYPVQILRRHLSVEECVSASDECGAPIVSVAEIARDLGDADDGGAALVGSATSI